jgi:hypothetical protein
VGAQPVSSDSGSVKPIKSKHQAHPWEPTVDTSDGSQSAAGKDYTDVYGGSTQSATGDQGGDAQNEKSGREPILTMAYTSAPDFIASADSGSGSKNAPTAMESGAFNVHLATLHSTEQTCLDATSAMITGYDSLKTEVDKAASDENFFGQQTGHWETNQGLGMGAWNSQHWVPDDYSGESQEFAAAIVPQMKNVLNSIGNVIEACGQFNALLNNAGQIYATIDHNAEFKDS